MSDYFKKDLNLGYTPEVPAYWPVVPTTIVEALNELIKFGAGINIDGGVAQSVYGGIPVLDGGDSSGS